MYYKHQSRRWYSGVYNTCYGSGGGALVFIIHVTDQEVVLWSLSTPEHYLLIRNMYYKHQSTTS
jgi:hypothetical protein